MKNEWNGKWPRYDPTREMWLCEGCWNNQDWDHHCTGGICGCDGQATCGRWAKRTRKPKPEPQPNIPFTSAEWIGPQAEQMKHQQEILNKSTPVHNDQG